MTTPEDIEKKLEASLLTNKVQTEVMAYVRDLANQVEALQADAERYRWLRGHTATIETSEFDGCYKGGQNDPADAADLDTAVDAARKAT